MMSRKAWGYDKLIALLEEHGIDDSLAADIKAIRTVAEKEDEDAGYTDTDRRSNCICFDRDSDNITRVEQGR